VSAPLRRVTPTAVVVALAVALTACSGSSSPRATKPLATSPSTVASSTTTTRPTTTTPTPRSTVTPTTRAPRARVTTPPATTPSAPFTGTVAAVSAAELGATYHAGCPVGPVSLRMLHLSYWGFDDRAHVGAMVVSAAVVQPVIGVFATLFRGHFPIRRMVPVSAYGGSDDASMAADNTSAFNCRTVAGSSNWSEHAYGEAIDVNTVENPYLVAGTVEPPAGRAYLDRSRLGPGMAGPGTIVNNAFASIGWPWGGRFHSPDYQHFSKSGR
jgi:hypothetical protein